MKKTRLPLIFGVVTVTTVLATRSFLENYNNKKWNLKVMCKKMAIIDSNISYNELGGNSINGEKINLKPKEEDIEYRYKLFLDMYKRYTLKQLNNEYKKLKVRYENSKQYVNEQPQDLEIQFF